MLRTFNTTSASPWMRMSVMVAPFSCLTALSLSRRERPDPGSVAAGGHVAPAAATVAAGVKEEPAAPFARAALDPLQRRFRQQVRRRADNRPQRLGQVDSPRR